MLPHPHKMSFPSWYLSSTFESQLFESRSNFDCPAASTVPGMTSGTHGDKPTLLRSTIKSPDLIQCYMGSCVRGFRPENPHMIIVPKPCKQERQDPYLEHVSIPVKRNALSGVEGVQCRQPTIEWMVVLLEGWGSYQGPTCGLYHSG